MKKFIFLIIFLGLFFSVHAQPDFDPDQNDVPIDGGISLLLAAGLGYGAKKARDVYKASKDQGSE
ncbi:MAG: hypothetical protein RI924_31 [Bacteroidota bacterium]|jgi:hypothetical protein